jgi:hypothetical protein
MSTPQKNKIKLKGKRGSEKSAAFSILMDFIDFPIKSFPMKPFSLGYKNQISWEIF